jgi:hypothetical protein
LRETKPIGEKKTRKLRKESRRIKREQKGKEKSIATKGRCKRGKAMRKEAITATMKRSNQL